MMRNDDDDMAPYLKRSIKATFVIVVIFNTSLLLYYRHGGIGEYDQQQVCKKFLK